ncbi:MAG: dihydrodipicolinate synthase family protein [Bacteroidales bacterium]|nr:dihydrodipicolinate synthase family protein [Bacteroidales bacterium]
MEKKIKGIIAPMVTPLSGPDELDREGTANLVEHIISGGVHCIFILGSTGEAQSLSKRLRKEFVELVCSLVGGRVPVLVGITDTSLRESLEIAELSERCGALGVVVAPPYYFPISQVELYEYYTALADSLPLPLYLYNIPSNVKSILEVSTVLRLAEHPNIAGLKDSSANMVYFRTLCHYLGGRDNFALYVGSEELLGECVLIGADGGVNGGANMFPELYVSMYDAASKEDLQSVRRIQERIMTVSRSIYTVGKYGSSYLKGLKCALSLLGICPDYMEWPFRKFLPSERVLIRKALMDLGYKELR